MVDTVSVYSPGITLSNENRPRASVRTVRPISTNRTSTSASGTLDDAVTTVPEMVIVAGRAAIADGAASHIESIHAPIIIRPPRDLRQVHAARHARRVSRARLVA